MESGALVLLGGAGGIAGAIAESCLRGLSRPVWITYNSDRESAESLAGTLGAGATVRHCDVADSDSLAALHNEIVAAGQVIDVLIHAAVAPIVGTLIATADQLLTALDVSAVSLVRALAKLNDAMASGSSVVYLTSIGSRRVIPAYGAIGVAKSAAESMVRYLAAELGDRGIRVNAVECGAMETKALHTVFADAAAVVERAQSRTPLRPPPDFSDIGAFVSMLTGPAGRGVTGQVISVDGGHSLR
jgi:enoyl-[acyl-carrier-protein] reductase (NADH)